MGNSGINYLTPNYTILKENFLLCKTRKKKQLPSCLGHISNLLFEMGNKNAKPNCILYCIILFDMPNWLRASWCTFWSSLNHQKRCSVPSISGRSMNIVKKFLLIGACIECMVQIHLSLFLPGRNTAFLFPFLLREVFTL